MPSVEQLEKLLAADPNDPFLLYGIAQEHAKRGNLAASLDHFDRCLAADPAYCYAYFHKARVLHEAGKTPDAVRALREGAAAAKKAGDAHALSEISGFLDEIE